MSRPQWRAIAAVSLAFCFLPQVALADTSANQQQIWETQIGQQTYSQYQMRGEIVPPQSPLYQAIDSITKPIANVADPQYFTPFHFVLLNDPSPNAQAMPGGNVYVTTGMLSFLKNRDELAGVICHEVNHDIHHDMYNVYQATQGGRMPQDPNAIALERQAETNADRAGAYTCAKAGFNPWGMVWNFRLHGQTPMAAAQEAPNSDHPSDAKRASDLIALLDGDPATFGRFKDDVAMATPLAVPQVQASQQYSYQRPQYPAYPQQQYPAYPQQQYPGYPQQQYPGYPQQQYPAYPQQQYPGYPQQQYPGYPQQQYPAYPQQQYPGYPQQQYPGYPQQQYPGYPQQQYPGYPQQQQQPQQGPYPPPPLPPCYPNC